MAIFHLSTRTSRFAKAGKTVNSANHFAYITRQEKYSVYKDLTYSETGKLPECEGMKDQKDFWKAADSYKRKNGRTYREVTLGLQEEFTKEENIELIHKFMDHFGIRNHQVYAFAIHDKQASYDPHHRNVHCHLMFNERILNERKFEHPKEIFKRWAGPSKENTKGGLKVDAYFNNREFVSHMRTYWEKINNEKFEELGMPIRISSKTLRQQREQLKEEGRFEEAEALNRKAAQHMGPAFKYPDTQAEVVKRANKIEDEINENRKNAEQRIIGALKREDIICEEMEDNDIELPTNIEVNLKELLLEEEVKRQIHDEDQGQQKEKNTGRTKKRSDFLENIDFEEDDLRKPTNEMIDEIENKKISRQTFDKLVELEFEKILKEKREAEEAKRKSSQSRKQSIKEKEKELFEIKKEIMANDIVIRRLARQAQYAKAELNNKRYKRTMYALKQFGYDEALATDGIIITVNDVCKEISTFQKKELETIQKLKTKIERRTAKARMDDDNETIAMDKITDGKYSEVKSKIYELNKKIKELQVVTHAPIQDLKDYNEKTLKEKELKKQKEELERKKGRYEKSVQGSGKYLYLKYLKEASRNKKIAEKYNDADMEAIKKHKELAALLTQREKELKESFPKETILYGENVPSKVLLTYKINGQEIKRMPFIQSKEDIYFIVNKPYEPEFGKEIKVKCVKVGEEAPDGKAKLYDATVLVEQRKIGAKGIVIPRYIPINVTPTKETILLYNVDNPDSRLKLNPRSKNGRTKSIKVKVSRNGPRVTMTPAESHAAGQSALAGLLQNSITGTSTIKDKVQKEEKSADRKTAEAAKRDDVTKEMALENEQLENGEWVQFMRANYGNSGRRH